MFNFEQLHVIPSQRELIDQGIGEKYAHGVDRVIIPVDHQDKWINLASESLGYVKT